MFGIKEDINNIVRKDPSAISKLDVLLNYPGMHAVWAYRVTHWLWSRQWKVLAKMLSTIARAITNVEIHPGAVIGKRLFIDHGTGTVIGARATIGDDCLIYHGVTIGGARPFDFNLDKPQETDKKTISHARIGDRVIIGAGAKVLGDITVEDDAIIGANSVVLTNIKKGVTAVGSPAKSKNNCLEVSFSHNVSAERASNA